jgi:hypothetical protein
MGVDIIGAPVGPVIIILRVLETFPTVLIALTVKLNVPTVVGVPEIIPPVVKLKPFGKKPLVIDQISGVGPLALII